MIVETKGSGLVGVLIDVSRATLFIVPAALWWLIADNVRRSGSEVRRLIVRKIFNFS